VTNIDSNEALVTRDSAAERATSEDTRLFESLETRAPRPDESRCQARTETIQRHRLPLGRGSPASPARPADLSRPVSPGMVQQSQGATSQACRQHSSLGGQPAVDAVPVRQSRARPATAGAADARGYPAGAHGVASQSDDDVAPGDERRRAPGGRQRGDRPDGDDDGDSGAHHDERCSPGTRGRHLRSPRFTSGARGQHAARASVDDAASGRAQRADLALAQRR